MGFQPRLARARAAASAAGLRDVPLASGPFNTRLLPDCATPLLVRPGVAEPEFALPEEFRLCDRLCVALVLLPVPVPGPDEALPAPERKDELVRAISELTGERYTGRLLLRGVSLALRTKVRVGVSVEREGCTVGGPTTGGCPAAGAATVCPSAKGVVTPAGRGRYPSRPAKALWLASVAPPTERALTGM